MHDVSLITTVAAALTAALVLGLLTQRIGLSPIVGYLLAGVLIGPYTPGFVGDIHIAQQLAEIGVILLMFGVGLHFHLKDLLAVKGVAIPGAVGQSLVATLLAIAVFAAFDVPLKTGAVIGMAMAVASTVVLMRVLMDADVLSSPQGHVAVGWLIVEDIFTVILLVMIPVLGSPAIGESGAALLTSATAPAATATAPALAADSSVWQTLGLALAKLAALVAIVLFAGSRIVPRVMVHVARLRSRELFTLTVLVLAIAIAAGSYFFFGASMALGAFLAGMVVAQSPVSHQAAADALPMRDAFAVLFFVSVGMLFDPAFVVQAPLMIVAGLGIILIAKPLAALVIVAILGHSTLTGLTVALGLAQIGEFSFILSELARRHSLMTDAGHNLLVACAIISITINPLLFRLLPTIETALRRRPRLWHLLNGRAERRAVALNAGAADALGNPEIAGDRLTVVVGYGPVGRSVHRLVRDAGLRTCIIDLNLDTVSTLNAEGQAAIYGDASHESILDQAGVRRASHVILTLPHASERAAIVTAVRSLNPTARVLVRARYLRERDELERAGATAAVFEEAEAAVGLARLVLADTGVHRDAAERIVRDLRLQLIMENIAGIRAQRVRGIMVPWTRVRRLVAGAARAEVFREIARERFTRWPVVDPRSGRAIGYLLTKDLIADAPDADWMRLLRPLHAINPGDDVESTLARMQNEGASMYVVEDAGAPVGLITLEDILEQFFGRIEDEYIHAPDGTLLEAVRRGGGVLNLSATTADEAIHEMAAAIRRDLLPPRVDQAEVARLALAREAEVPTDLGIGVAIPHARVLGLAAPLVILGRSHDGIVFSTRSPEAVRIIFLLVTPIEQPDVQLTLLGRVASLAGNAAVRAALLRTNSLVEVFSILEAPPPGRPASG